MAKPNYDFEKRQRELAKKRKKEEKLKKKTAGSGDDPSQDEQTEDGAVKPAGEDQTPA
jgi:hypothetical protein